MKTEKEGQNDTDRTCVKEYARRNCEESFPQLNEGRIQQNNWHYWVLDLIGKAQNWFPVGLLREYLWEAVFLDEEDCDTMPYTMAKWDNKFLTFLTKDTSAEF